MVNGQGGDDAAHRARRKANLPTDHRHRLVLPSERQNPGDLCLARTATLQGQAWLTALCRTDDLVDLVEPDLELRRDGATAQTLPTEVDDCAAKLPSLTLPVPPPNAPSAELSRIVVETRSVANLANTAFTVCG